MSKIITAKVLITTVEEIEFLVDDHLDGKPMMASLENDAYEFASNIVLAGAKITSVKVFDDNEVGYHDDETDEKTYN